MTSKQNAKILVVDDDEEIIDSISEYLQEEGFETIVTTQPQTVMRQLAEMRIDLVILDMMMPDLNGINLSKQIKRIYQIPILMLTAVDDDLEKVVALETVVDDYMTKPFSLSILKTHIMALLRRFKKDTDHKNIANYEFDGWKLELEEKRLYTPAGVFVTLTRAEFALLHIFLEQPHTTLSRETLLEALQKTITSSDLRKVDLLVSGLRGKLDRANKEAFIRTIRQQGYCFDATVTKV